MRCSGISDKTFPCRGTPTGHPTDEMQIRAEDLQSLSDEILGYGHFSNVYKGLLAARKRQPLPSGRAYEQRLYVAVKVLTSVSASARYILERANPRFKSVHKGTTYGGKLSDTSNSDPIHMS